MCKFVWKLNDLGIGQNYVEWIDWTDIVHTVNSYVDRKNSDELAEEINRRFPISSRRLTHESHSAELFSTFEWLPLLGLPSTTFTCVCVYECFVDSRTRLTNT